MQKDWYKSKGAWGGVLVAAGGIALAIGKLLLGELDYMAVVKEVIPLVGAGLGIIGIRLGNDWKK